MAPPKVPLLPLHAEDVDPSERDAMHLEGVKYFLEHPPSETQESEAPGVLHSLPYRQSLLSN